MLNAHTTVFDRFSCHICLCSFELLWSMQICNKLVCLREKSLVFCTVSLLCIYSNALSHTCNITAFQTNTGILMKESDWVLNSTRGHCKVWVPVCLYSIKVLYTIDQNRASICYCTIMCHHNKVDDKQ